MPGGNSPAGAPPESERRLSATPHPHHCRSFDSLPTCPTLPSTPRLPGHEAGARLRIPALSRPRPRPRALFPAPPGTVISLICLSSGW